MKLTATQKNLIVIGGVAVAILLLVKIIGVNKITSIFDSGKKEQILQLKEKIKQDSIKVVFLQETLKQQQDSVRQYQELYKQEKANYKVITKYYEKKIIQVQGMTSKESIEYFTYQTDCEDSYDTNVITRLSNILCANIKFVEREMFLSQRDTLQDMNTTLECEVNTLQQASQTQADIILLQNTQLSNYKETVSTQEQIVNDLEKAKKKTDKKVKRVKTIAIIGCSAAVVLGAVLILQ